MNCDSLGVTERPYTADRVRLEIVETGQHMGECYDGGSRSKTRCKEWKKGMTGDVAACLILEVHRWPLE